GLALLDAPAREAGRAEEGTRLRQPGEVGVAGGEHRRARRAGAVNAGEELRPQRGVDYLEVLRHRSFDVADRGVVVDGEVDRAPERLRDLGDLLERVLH